MFDVHDYFGDQTVFLSVVEIACTLLIVWYAWKWRGPETIVAAAKVERGMPS